MLDIDLAVSNSFLKVDLIKVRNNYRRILEHVSKDVKVASVLKSNAYGFGIKYIAPVVMHEGCRDIFVTYLSEANLVNDIALELCINDVNIFILSPAVNQNFETIIERGYIPVLRTLNEIKTWIDHSVKSEKKLPCVLKFDTGMNRFGIKPYEITKLLSLNPLKFLDIKYIMSHMSSANYLNSDFNEFQYNNMKQISEAFPGIPVTFGNSYSIFFDRPMQFDMVRVGRLIYGETDSLLNNQIYSDIGLEPVFSTYSRVLQVKNVVKGEAVGYGASYIVPKDGKIAVIGIGYSEGYHTLCKDRSWFIINGRKAKVIGGVSMEYTMCDISEINNVHEGDIVTVIGDGISLNQMAATINVGSLELVNHFFSTMKNKIYFHEDGKIESIKTGY